MAWILVTGEDVIFYQNALRVLRSAGHQLVASADGSVALQLLVDVDHEFVVLLREWMGQMNVAEFLSAVDVNDTLRWQHAYLLLDGTSDTFSTDAERHFTLLAAPVVTTPGDASDVDDWGDLLDAIELAVRQLPSKRGT